MNLETIKLACNKCGAPVEILAALSKHVKTPTCEECGTRGQEKQEMSAKLERMRQRWLQLCPPLFRDTIFDKLPRRELSEAAVNWKYNPKGLNLWGFPGTGKTRTAFLILEREHFNGRHCRSIGPGEFQAADKAERAKWLKAVERAELVLFDDVDKFKLSAAHEDSFFAVVDHRAKYKRPTLWTGNSSGESLKVMFTHGEALVRRIRQFNTSIHFK